MPHRFAPTLALLAGFGLQAFAQTQGTAPVARYQLDPMHTTVIFEVDHLNTSTLRGRFDRKQGQAQFDPVAKTGSVQVTVEAQSISTGVPALDQALTGEKLFHAERFPDMVFESQHFEWVGDKVKAVQGQLTLLGQTHPLSLNALRFNCHMSSMLKREICGGDFEATLDRTQWGMNFGLNFGAPRLVHLLIEVEGLRE